MRRSDFCSLATAQGAAAATAATAADRWIERNTYELDLLLRGLKFSHAAWHQRESHASSTSGCEVVNLTLAHLQLRSHGVKHVRVRSMNLFRRLEAPARCSGGACRIMPASGMRGSVLPASAVVVGAGGSPSVRAISSARRRASVLSSDSVASFSVLPVTYGTRAEGGGH